jgi:DNA-binding PadR family transcriptional regulator
MLYKSGQGEPGQVSNAEFMLLQIICQAGEISGYKINKLVEERQYRIWAGIGTTSIYTGLEKLRKKGLVASRLDVAKRGKGPVPKKFRLTQRGQAALKKDIERALSSTRERDLRFDLAVAALPLLTLPTATSALRKRKKFLREVARQVNARFQALGGEGLPLNIKSLFKHSLHLIEHELEFVDVLILDLKKSKIGKETQ